MEWRLWKRIRRHGETSRDAVIRLPREPVGEAEKMSYNVALILLDLVEKRNADIITHGEFILAASQVLMPLMDVVLNEFAGGGRIDTSR